MKTIEEKIVKLNNKTQEIINRNDLDWEQKYDKIFSDKISMKVQKLIRLDYYDPDTSYEEDVRAFASALNEWMANEA